MKLFRTKYDVGMITPFGYVRIPKYYDTYRQI